MQRIGDNLVLDLAELIEGAGWQLVIPLALQIIIIKVVSGQGLDLRESRFDTKYALLLRWSEMKVLFHLFAALWSIVGPLFNIIIVPYGDCVVATSLGLSASLSSSELNNK